MTEPYGPSTPTDPGDEPIPTEAPEATSPATAPEAPAAVKSPQRIIRVAAVVVVFRRGRDRLPGVLPEVRSDRREGRRLREHHGGVEPGDRHQVVLRRSVGPVRGDGSRQDRDCDSSEVSYSGSARDRTKLCLFYNVRVGDCLTVTPKGDGDAKGTCAAGTLKVLSVRTDTADKTTCPAEADEARADVTRNRLICFSTVR